MYVRALGANYPDRCERFNSRCGLVCIQGEIHTGSGASKYPGNWLSKLDFADVLFIASLALLFYFGVQHFPFGTRDELSLCALVGGFAAFLRMTEGPS